MALSIEKIVPDRGHDTKYPGVVNDGDGRCRGTHADEEVHDAVRYFHRRRDAKM